MKIGFIGGTGNVGQCVLRNLVSYPEEQVSQVVCVNRRKANPEELPEDQSRMVEHVVDMSPGTDVEPLFADVLSDIDVLVGTIGIGSGKGDVETFRWVEVELATTKESDDHRNIGLDRKILNQLVYWHTVVIYATAL
tara:strand:- start:25 stop:435 length:411 start_codon:yes stop_codon:yes gene_type:complete